jgi:hypothetical protein
MADATAVAAAASELGKTNAHIAAPMPQDPNNSHSDPNKFARQQRVKALEEALNEESGGEGAVRKLKELDEVEAKQAGKYERATGKGPPKAKADTVDEAEGSAAATRVQEAEDEAEAAETAAEEPETAATEEPETVVDGTEPQLSEREQKLAAQEKERKERFDRTLRLQVKNREQADKIRRAEDALLEREEQILQRERDIDGRLSQAQQRVTLAERVLKLAEDNPLELLERAGVPPARVAAWLREAGDPQKQGVSAVQKEINDLRAQLEEEKRRMAAQAEKQAAEANRREIDRQFLATFDKGDEYEPARLVYSNRERIALGDEIADKLNKKNVAAHKAGRTRDIIRFSLSDVADAVNEMAKADDRWEAIRKKTAQPAAPKPTAAAAPPAPAKPKPAPAVALTQATSTTRTDPPTPERVFDARTTNLKRRARLDRMYADLDAGKR